MSKSIIESCFKYQDRKYFITSEYSDYDSVYTMQLKEEIQVKGRPLKHYIQSDGILDKTEPIVFACKNEIGEIEISMQYEGFPLEPLFRFLRTVHSKWNSNSETY